MNRVFQDIQQIRQICQQLSQTENQNAQLFAQTPGMQQLSQREAFAAQQLQQVVSLCNRVEQEIAQNVQSATSVLGASQFGGSQFGLGGQFSNSALGGQFGSQFGQPAQSQGVNQSVLNQVLQAGQGQGSFGGFSR